mmetsp:Transcript_88394/g.258346  ORF Transcript_88394/g.258346 Transcript_88394/m.258346 type:complete len:326 (+) Transcript_88394:46-1023(+)
MTQLSRERAVSLSAELRDVVRKLRMLEAKYGLEDQSEAPLGLGVKLLAALRPYAQDPTVAAHALQAELQLMPCQDCLPAPTSSKQVSQDSVSELSTGFSKQVSQDSVSELSTAWQSRRTTGDASDSLHSEPCEHGDLDLTPAGSRLLVTPRLGTSHRRTFGVKHCSSTTVAELRKLLADSMQLPQEKIRVISEIGREAVFLDDDEGIEFATTLFVCSTTNSQESGAAFSLEQALAMQQDFLENLTARSGPVSRESLKKLQASILLKHGIKPSPCGMTHILRTFDHYAWNAVIRGYGEQINRRLGMQPQVYDLQVFEGVCLATNSV